jgi:hypothetical protein
MMHLLLLSSQRPQAEAHAFADVVQIRLQDNFNH